MTNKVDIWFDLFNETEGFEDDILKPLHDRLGKNIFKFNKKTRMWEWTGKNFRLTTLEKDRLGYFNEDLDPKYDKKRIKILKYYNLLWDENRSFMENKTVF